MTTVAVLGTGRMGGAIARRLAASGSDVIVWDRTTAKARALTVGRVASTPADAIRDAAIVISSLTNADAVREVYLGSNGAFDNPATLLEKLFVEMSTAGPESIEALGQEARSPRTAPPRGARAWERPGR